MSKLFCNGCSITLGAELGEFKDYFDEAKTEPFMNVDTQYRKDHRWSTILANKLGYQPVNIAKGAGSNWRIWRTTLDYFNRPENRDFEGMAVIQLTGTERWQMPINETFIHQFHSHLDKDDREFVDWIKGGIYAPDHDDADPVVEEYLPWNQGNMRYVKDRSHKMHEHYSDEMISDIVAQTRYISPIHNCLDLMRIMESLIYFFKGKDIPLYFWDGMRNFTTIENVKKCLHNMENFDSEDHFVEFMRTGNFAAIIELFYDYERFLSSDERSHRAFYRFIKHTKLYDRVVHKWEMLRERKELIYVDFADMYMSNITLDRPRRHWSTSFVGAKPGGHPDEKCHQAISDKLYDYVAV